MREEKRLAAFAAGLRYEDLSESAAKAAKQSVLDCLAAAIGGSGESFVEILREVVLPADGATDASLFGTNRLRAAAMNAALLNGAASGAGAFAAGASVIAAAAPAVAVAEKEHRNGQELLAAIAAAMETAARLDGPGPSVSGAPDRAAVIIAAVSSARILGLSPEKTAQAISMAEGQREEADSAADTAMMRSLRIGKACCAGVLSAYLARAGFMGAAGAADAETGGVRPEASRIFPILPSWEESRRNFLAVSVPIVGEARGARLAEMAETLDESDDIAASFRDIL